MYLMNRNNSIDPYLQQKVMTASPTELVVYLYDIGISSCIKRQDRVIKTSHISKNLLIIHKRKNFPIFCFSI